MEIYMHLMYMYVFHVCPWIVYPYLENIYNSKDKIPKPKQVLPPTPLIHLYSTVTWTYRSLFLLYRGAKKLGKLNFLFVILSSKCAKKLKNKQILMKESVESKEMLLTHSTPTSSDHRLLRASPYVEIPTSRYILSIYVKCALCSRWCRWDHTWGCNYVVSYLYVGELMSMNLVHHAQWDVNSKIPTGNMELISDDVPILWLEPLIQWLR